MDLTYSIKFLDDLVEIIRYYNDKNINCEKIIFDILKKVEFLKTFPKMGVQFVESRTNYNCRYIVAGKYLVFYELDEVVYIKRVLHSKRNFASIIFEDLVPV